MKCFQMFLADELFKVFKSQKEGIIMLFKEIFPQTGLCQVAKCDEHYQFNIEGS